MTQRTILLLSIVISILTAVRSNKNIKVIHKRLNVENQERNSLALNNFLKEVLSAKDELKWIDQMIYPRVNDHKYPKTRRRLLATRNGRSVNRKNYWGYAGNSVDADDNYDDDDDDDYQDYFDGTDMLTDIKRSLHAGVKKKRRLNLDDNGLEYDDYDSNEEKCEPVADRGILIKKMNNKTESVEPKTVFLTPERFNSQKSSFKRDNLQVKNDLQNDDESDNEIDDNLEYEGDNNDDQFNGPEARYHRDQDDEAAQLALEESDFEDDNQKYKRTVQDDDIFNYLDNIPFDLSSPEVGNTSSSGSDYHALKATDDMFKGGIEQGDSIEDKIDNFKKISQTETGKTDPPYLKKSKWYSYLKLSQRTDEKSSGKIDKSTDKGVRKKQESREKRLSVNDMPIMHHESIVEPSNWPWEYYDDKDDMRIKFGRGLMQVSNKKFSRSMKSRRKMRSRNSFINLKFINSTNLSHSLKKSNFRSEHKRLKNHFNRVSFPYEKKRHYNKKFQLKRFAREAENKDEDKDKDISQIHFGVNGKVAYDIVDKIFDEVEQNPYLKEGLTFQKSNKSTTAVANKGDNETVVEENKTEETMKTVRELLETYIKQEVKERTCLKLPKCLEKFLTWIVETENDADSADDKAPKTSDSDEKKKEQRKVLYPTRSKSTSSENLPPPENPSENKLPEKSRLIAKSVAKIKSEPTNSSKSNELDKKDYTSRIDFLFGELHVKMKLLKRLLKAYHRLSYHEQEKVKAVHDYLRRQLKALEKFEELKKKIPNFPTLPPFHKMINNNLISTHQDNSLNTSHGNGNSLLSLFSSELTKRNKLKDLKEKEVEKIKKLKRKKIDNFLNDNYRQKRAMAPDNQIKKIEKLTSPLGTTASDEYLSMALKKFSNICNSKETENFSNETTETLAYSGDKSKIKYNEYDLTRTFPSSASTLVPSAPAFSYFPTVKQNRLMINNKNNQIKMTSIASKNLMKNNEITLQLSTSTTPKHSLVTLESAKLLESKINIFPVDS